jgi:hypothetical protein
VAVSRRTYPRVESHPLQDPIIGHRAFVGGVVLPVYLDHRGRQYAEGDDGEPLYGLWLYEGEDDDPQVLTVPAGGD